MRTSIDGLGDSIMSQLEEWTNGELKQAVNEGLKETAAAAERALKQGGPYTERTGKYTKDWTHDVRGSRASAITGLNRYSVYNQKHYQLTHLLEKGHQARHGGRVRAFEHIGPVNDTLGELAVQKITQKVRG